MTSLNKAEHKGNSMWPSIKDGDVVLFEKKNKELNIGDVALFYCRNSKEIVAHRLVSLEPFLTKGDWANTLDDFKQDCVVGSVCGIERMGRIIEWNGGGQLIAWLSLKLVEKSHLKYLYKSLIYIIGYLSYFRVKPF